MGEFYVIFVLLIVYGIGFYLDLELKYIILIFFFVFVLGVL